MTHSFTTSITNPITDESARVEVFYSMRDVGVTSERVRAVILSVALDSNRDDGAPYELLDQLNNETIVDLAEAATTHWHDQVDLARFGGESV